MVQASETTDWIEWTGGKCPLIPGQRYAYRSRDGFECPETIADDAHCLNAVWMHSDTTPGWDIIAYRVVQA